jgi:hypothetical protein
MSIYETEFSRRIRSSVPPSPSSPGRYGAGAGAGGGAKKGGDVFGDITVPVRNGSPRGMSPAGKGKGMTRDYGDRSVHVCG